MGNNNSPETKALSTRGSLPTMGNKISLLGMGRGRPNSHRGEGHSNWDQIPIVDSKWYDSFQFVDQTSIRNQANKDIILFYLSKPPASLCDTHVHRATWWWNTFPNEVPNIWWMQDTFWVWKFWRGRTTMGIWSKLQIVSQWFHNLWSTVQFWIGDFDSDADWRPILHRQTGWYRLHPNKLSMTI